MATENHELPEVRLRLSTLSLYISTLYRFVASLLFTLIVIRRLDVEEYGLFVLGFSIVNSIAIIYNLWVPWGVRRYILKISEAVSASLILNLVYGVIGVVIYILATLYYTNLIGEKAFQIIIFIILIASSPVTMLSQAAIAVINPQFIALIGILFETLRISLAYLLVVYLNQGLTGAVLALGTSSIIVFTYGLFKLIRKGYIRFRFTNIAKEIRFQLKASATSIFNVFGTILENLDRVVVTLLTASSSIVAFMGVAYVPRNIISRSLSAVALSTYSKTLRDPQGIYLTESIRLYLLFTGLLMGLLISLSRPIVSFLNPAYIDVWIPVMIITLEIFILGFARVINAASTGISREDLEARSINELTKTPIGRIYIYEFLRSVIGFGGGTSVFLLLSLLYRQQLNPWDVSLIYAASWLISSIIFLMFSIKIISRFAELKFPYREFISFISGIATVAVFIYITGASNIVIRSFWSDSPKLFIYILIGSAIYLFIFITTSRWAREQFKRILNIIFNILH